MLITRKIFLSLLGLGAAFALSACDPAMPVSVDESRANETGVVGGTGVPHASPFASSTVEIRRYVDSSGSSYTLCSGVLITNDIVLTAAHCFADDNRPMATTVVLGIKSHQPGDQPTDERHVLSFRVHPGYTPSEMRPLHDLAILKFSPALASSLMFPKIEMRPPPINSIATYVGYGLPFYDLPSTTYPPEILRSVALPIGRVTKDQNEIDVALKSNRGISRGDSGGPLFVPLGTDWAVVAIATEMNLVTNPPQASFTLVYPHLQWIRDSIDKLRAMATKKN